MTESINCRWQLLAHSQELEQLAGFDKTHSRDAPGRPVTGNFWWQAVSLEGVAILVDFSHRCLRDGHAWYPTGEEMSDAFLEVNHLSDQATEYKCHHCTTLVIADGSIYAAGIRRIVFEDLELPPTF